MTWRKMIELELLVAVAQCDSLTQAAAQCGIAQPNASRSIARLEREIGCPLLIRSTTGSQLSAQGKKVANWAAELLAAEEKFAKNLASLGNQASQELDILVSQTIAECYAPAWLADFQAIYPRVTVKLSVANSEQICRKQLAGDARVGLIETPNIPAGLTTKLIGYDQLVVIVSSDHRWAKRKTPISLAQLAKTRMLVREEGSGTRDTLEAALAGFDTLPPAMVASSNAAVLGSVIAGNGPAVLSAAAAANACAAGLVRIVDVLGADKLRRPLHAIWHPGAPLLGPAADFLSRLGANAA